MQTVIITKGKNCSWDLKQHKHLNIPPQVFQIVNFSAVGRHYSAVTIWSYHTVMKRIVCVGHPKCQCLVWLMDFFWQRGEVDEFPWCHHVNFKYIEQNGHRHAFHVGVILLQAFSATAGERLNGRFCVGLTYCKPSDMLWMRVNRNWSDDALGYINTGLFCIKQMCRQKYIGAGVCIRYATIVCWEESRDYFQLLELVIPSK